MERVKKLTAEKILLKARCDELALENQYVRGLAKYVQEASRFAESFTYEG